jgi:peptide/nickel transport system permease protein
MTTIAESGAAAPSRRRVHPLIAYALRRTAITVLLLALVSVLIFLATQVLPGNAAAQILGHSGATGAERAQLSRQLGLDRPLIDQYGSWIGGVLHGDLGRSFASNEPVTAFISARIGNSAVLALAAVLVMLPIAVVLGIVAGVRRGRLADHAISGASLGLIALPEFVSGTILAVFFGVTLAVFPPTSIIPSGSTPLSDPKLLVLPVLTLSIAGSAYIIRMLRAGVAEAMASEYVQAARLNGLPERRIIVRHALRNALAPTVQVVALTVQWLFGGIVIVETVFSYPGLGQGLVQAVTARDIPVVQSLVLVIAAFYLAVNLVADIVVILLVPKLRTSL